MTVLYNVLTVTVSFILIIVKIIIVNVWQTSILMTTDQLIPIPEWPQEVSTPHTPPDVDDASGWVVGTSEGGLNTSRRGGKGTSRQKEGRAQAFPGG